MMLSTSEECAKALKEGRVIAYPTEGVWGLGCDPFNQDALQQLLDLKQRPSEKGLILLADSPQQIADLTPLSDHELQTLQVSSNTTFLIPFHKNTLPTLVTGSHELVAVRISNHPVVKALCKAFNGPITSTSANLTGSPTAETAEEIARLFPNLRICQGVLGCDKKPSRIISFLSGDILRD